MKVIFGEAYLPINNAEESFIVSAYYPKAKLKKGNAYIIGDYVYPYRGKAKKDKHMLPGIYRDGDGILIVDEGITDDYKVDNIVELDPRAMLKAIKANTERFIQPEDIEIVSNNAEIYQPIIKDDDDFLKYLVKRIISEKQINLRNYRNKFPNEYALNNMKSSLNRSTKMTVTNFRAWCEILGVRWSMNIQDDGTDTVNPLEDDIEIHSDDF